MSFIVGVVVGALVGWFVPTPAWVQSVIDKIRG